MDAPGQLVQLLGRRLAPPLREQLARRGNGGWIASQHQVDLADERGRIRLLDPVCPRQVPFGAREARTCVRQRVHALQRGDRQPGRGAAEVRPVPVNPRGLDDVVSDTYRGRGRVHAHVHGVLEPARDPVPARLAVLEQHPLYPRGLMF